MNLYTSNLYIETIKFQHPNLHSGIDDSHTAAMASGPHSFVIGVVGALNILRICFPLAFDCKSASYSDPD